jgi:aminoglycoside phosphotransferase family enzyme
MKKIIDALMKPEAYDEHIKQVRLIQTHISCVFLTGDFVYKIKKPVNFGFLDFSTLGKRKHFCELELDINKMFSPDIYLGVLSISEKNGKLKINGDGVVVEYALKMKELPQDALMSKLLEKNKIDKKIIDEIIDILIGFYSKTRSGPAIDKFGSIETIKFNWDENFDQTEEFIGKVLDGKAFDQIKQKVNRFMEKNKNLFEKRVKDGFIRWCHGDLHSGNIFIVSNKIYIFDAIEFNERFACLDMANDVAFLAMDLEFRDRKDLSVYFIKKFIEKTGDLDLPKLLPFYKCYKAYVRGKVTAFKINDPHISEKEKRESMQTSKRYFDLALEYSREF